MFKVKKKTPERCHWRRSGVFILNFEQVAQLAFAFWLLTPHKLISAEYSQSVHTVYMIPIFLSEIPRSAEIFCQVKYAILSL